MKIFRTVAVAGMAALVLTACGGGMTESEAIAVLLDEDASQEDREEAIAVMEPLWEEREAEAMEEEDAEAAAMASTVDIEIVSVEENTSLRPASDLNPNEVPETEGATPVKITVSITNLTDDYLPFEGAGMGLAMDCYNGDGRVDAPEYQIFIGDDHMKTKEGMPNRLPAGETVEMFDTCAYTNEGPLTVEVNPSSMFVDENYIDLGIPNVTFENVEERL